MNEQKRNTQDYDAWLHWYILTECNLNCEYCFSNPDKKEDIKAAETSPPTSKKVFSVFAIAKKIRKALGMSIPHLIRILNFRASKKKGKICGIDIPALIKALTRTRKTFKISFSGGEPFLIPNIIDALEEVTQKHYVHIITNLVTGDIAEFAERIKPERVVSIHASLHIKELERLDLVNTFIDNFLLCRGKGFVINAFEIAYPPLLHEAEKYRCFFKKKGIDIYFSPFVGTYNGKSYPGSYTVQERAIFGLAGPGVQAYYQKGKMCNAGYNVGVVSLTGDITVCSQINEKIGNIYEEIAFKGEMMICPYDCCECPLGFNDKYLFEKALYSTQSSHRHRM